MYISNIYVYTFIYIYIYVYRFFSTDEDSEIPDPRFGFVAAWGVLLSTGLSLCDWSRLGRANWPEP